MVKLDTPLHVLNTIVGTVLPVPISVSVARAGPGIPMAGLRGSGYTGGEIGRPA